DNNNFDVKFAQRILLMLIICWGYLFDEQQFTRVANASLVRHSSFLRNADVIGVLLCSNTLLYDLVN
ncbi:TPA: hypothetical protein ACH7K4_002636, partial [Escherichia coli]